MIFEKMFLLNAQQRYVQEHLQACSDEQVYI